MKTTQRHRNEALPQGLASEPIAAAEPLIMSGPNPNLKNSPHADRENRARALAAAWGGTITEFVRAHHAEIIQVRQDFLDKAKSKTIFGCTMWEQYVEERLHCSPQHMRRLLAGDNPATALHDGSANRKPTQAVSNREQRRQDFKAEHPEYVGKSNHEVDKAIQQMISSLPKGPKLTELIAAPYSEDLRLDMKGHVYYGEMTEEYAMYKQRRQERGIDIVGAEGRSHGHGLSRLREKAKGIRVRHSIQAEGSGSFSFIVTIRGLREREVIPLLQFQERQRWGDAPKPDIKIFEKEEVNLVELSPHREEKTRKRRTRKKESSPAGTVHVDELPPEARARVMAQMEARVAT